jgi:hypothetical protein
MNADNEAKSMKKSKQKSEGVLLFNLPSTEEEATCKWKRGSK